MSGLRNTVLWSVALFAFWVALSGKLDALHLAMGAACAAGVAAATRPLLALPPAIGPAASMPVTAGLVARFLLYTPWLLWRIVVASVQVAGLILHPRLPIEPRLLHVRQRLPHTLARLTLANSITLTPGTVTLDVEGDEYLIHALTGASAGELGDPLAEGGIQRRVRQVFGTDEESAA